MNCGRTGAWGLLILKDPHRVYLWQPSLENQYASNGVTMDEWLGDIPETEWLKEWRRDVAPEEPKKIRESTMGRYLVSFIDPNDKRPFDIKHPPVPGRPDWDRRRIS